MMSPLIWSQGALAGGLGLGLGGDWTLLDVRAPPAMAGWGLFGIMHTEFPSSRTGTSLVAIWIPALTRKALSTPSFIPG